MKLLPYGIPIAVGSIVYFAWCGAVVLMEPSFESRGSAAPAWGEEGNRR